MHNVIKALKANTAATKANTVELERRNVESNKSTSLSQRRKDIREGGPYTTEQLQAMMRQDLVMYAAQLGVKNTSVPQATLVDSVLGAQDG